MKNTNKDHIINTIAKKAQHDGHIDELVTQIMPIISKSARRFMNKFPQVNLDYCELVSVASFECLTMALEGWDSARGSYLPRLNKYMADRFNNIMRAELRDKRVTLSHAVSIETPARGNLTIGDTLISPESTSTSTKDIEGFLHAYSVSKGAIKSEVARILIDYATDATARTRALCEVYGVPKYDATVRKRTSLIKKDFAQFLLKKNYVLCSQI